MRFSLDAVQMHPCRCRKGYAGERNGSCAPLSLYLHSTSEGLRLLLLLLEVKVYQGIDDELVDNETERGTAERGAKGPSHLAESGVLCRVVGHGEGSAGGVSGKESKVWRGMAAVCAGDDATGAA